MSVDEHAFARAIIAARTTPPEDMDAAIAAIENVVNELWEELTEEEEQALIRAMRGRDDD